MASELSRRGVERAVALSLQGVYYDYVQGNQETLQTSRRLSFLVPAATIDPRRFYGGRKEAVDLDGFAAIRVFPDLQNWPLDYAPFHRILEQAASHQLPVIAPAMGPGKSTEMVRAAKALDVNIVLSSVSYWTLSEALVLLAQYDKLYICTDMLDTPDAVELISDEVGPERMVFGSNYPFTYFGAPLMVVQTSEISQAYKRAILRENILRVLGIK